MKQWKTVVKDSFWTPRISKMCEEIIPYQYQVLNDAVDGIPASHAVENFKIAAGMSEGVYAGMLFQDSDVAKWIEAASYSLMVKRNEEVEKSIDIIIDIIEKAQREDGYLNTYYICAKQEGLTNIAHGHEMYCAGHLLEAAVAYAEASGKEKLLQVMERCLLYFMDRIGPDEGKKQIYPGHPELELALYKCYKYTKDEKYLCFMEFLINERGKQPSFFEQDAGYGEQYKDKWFSLPYHQAHMPVREQKTAVGHAVRAMYLYTAMAELAFEKKDKKLEEALEFLWRDVTKSKMYITGGLGAEAHGESFGKSYDLPNDRAYAETCASIGLIFWAKQMFILNHDSKYADVMELAFYNGAISGMSQDGKHYFYVNPLTMLPEEVNNRYDLSHVKAERVTWFGCACCPPNLARLLSSFPQYVCENCREEKSLYINLYAAGMIMIDNEEGSALEVEGDYVKDGHMKFTYRGNRIDNYLICFRIPGWCRNWKVNFNGEFVSEKTQKGYLNLKRNWKDGDCVELFFELLPQLVFANVRVTANAGRTALMRGPIVYCLEEADNGANLNAVIADISSGTLDYKEEYGADVQILFEAYREHSVAWESELYSYTDKVKKPVVIKAVPYYSWGNRTIGEMLVWMRYLDK